MRVQIIEYQKDDRETQLEGRSLKALTVGHEDDHLTPLPQREVETSQRVPADLTGVSHAAACGNSQKAIEEQPTSTPVSVRCYGTSLGRAIRKNTVDQVVDPINTPSRDPRRWQEETTPVARQLQFNFTPVIKEQAA